MREVSVALLLVSCAVYAYAQDDAVLGRWVGDQSIIEVRHEGEMLSARVVAINDPVYTAGEAFGPEGAPRRDDRNPNVALRERPIVGLDLLVGYAFVDGNWQGKIYDPESGNTYSSKMRLDRDGNLTLRGYIGVPMFGRTAVFLPISVCPKRAQDMLVLAGLQVCTAASRP